MKKQEKTTTKKQSAYSDGYIWLDIAIKTFSPQ